MHVLLTRPEPDAAAFAAQLAALGHTVTLEPLLSIEHLPIDVAALDGAAGLVATSRNGLRALASSPAFNAALALPIIAVGPGTAQLARELGFEHVVTGSGAATDLVPVIVAAARGQQGTFVHVRGEDVAFDLPTALRPRAIDVREVITYKARPACAFQPPTKELLASGAIDAVILMSPRTGAIFARLVAYEGLEKAVKSLVLLCLSPAVAVAIEPLAPARVEVADSPNSAAMLAAVTRVATLWSGV
jgi:uroporphyrinogen-III synthase